MKYLMGIDNGGTFSKAAIFDENGNQIAVASVATDLITPKSGYMERDMEQLWLVNVQAIKTAIEKSGISNDDIAGVSFSGHGKGLYLWNRENRNIYHGIISTDTRAWEYPKRWEQDGTAQKVYEKTFQEILACQPVSLLAWLKDHEANILEQSDYIFSVKDYIRYRLTGEAYGEYSDFSGGNLINLQTGTYDKELLNLFGLEDVWDKLPPLKKAHEICGYVTAQAAKITGLKVGTPVSAGMFDVNACGIASGLNDEQKLCMIAGTWSINEYISRKPLINKGVSLNSMFCIPDYYLVEESSPTSAGNMEWFIRNLMSYEKKEEESFKRSIYDITNKWVEEIAPEDSDLIFLPFLNGSNVNPLAKGTFIGLTSYHNKKHMLRAVYEGIVFSHATHVKRLLKNREAPETIQLSGGAANSKVWVQIFADVLQIPIETVENKELGAQGAAIAAGIGVGIYSGYDEAIQKTTHITGMVKPNPTKREIYQEKYDRYLAVIEALNLVWKRF
jgi:L-xylulokinase